MARAGRPGRYIDAWRFESRVERDSALQSKLYNSALFARSYVYCSFDKLCRWREGGAAALRAVRAASDYGHKGLQKAYWWGVVPVYTHSFA